ncbi:unnamed protein product [Caenorhabditis auriculariae]|uniref:Uncharacterized protein n=1 Tax=Caenorhabditis auriculariae TaxID=2777116 RepID=A0A8S1GP79_9PELO|nr:unnamed protein product [Caenorhabditis auriculariae]
MSSSKIVARKAQQFIFNPYMTKEGISMSAKQSSPPTVTTQKPTSAIDSSRANQMSAMFRGKANTTYPEESLQKNVQKLIKEEQERQQAYINISSARF